MSAALFGQIPSNVDFTAIILPYGGDTAPTGWLLCDGSTVSRTTFADLFVIIGTKYGTGDGSTTFNVPDLKGRLPVGKDGGIIDFDTLGKTGGAQTVTLTEAEIPSHNHGVTDPGHSHTYSKAQNAPAGNPRIADAADWQSLTVNSGSSTTGISIDSTGGGSAHENMPPFVIVQYIIKT